MDELRAQILDLLNRARGFEDAAGRFDTLEEFAHWVDEEFLQVDPQIPLANIYVLIDGL